MSAPQHNAAQHRFAVLTAIATLLLVGMGGLVTSHRAGMAVPDWPTSYGYNMFALPFQFWTGGAFYEHTHRLWASGVGFMTTVLAIWFYGRNARGFTRWTGTILIIGGIAALLAAPERRDDALMLIVPGAIALVAVAFGWPSCERSPRWLRRLGVIAFVAVVIQGVLGGLRVTLFKDEIGVFHGAIAQLFFVLICALALFTSRWWRRVSESRPASSFPVTLKRGAVVVTLLILAQLIIGATMRHQHAGLAIPDFPLAYGKLWPATDAESVMTYNQRRMEVTAANPITAAQIHLQMVHRLLAVIILGAVIWHAWRSIRRFRMANAASKFALVLLGLILAQVVLGAATIWTNKAADIATLHVLVGALSLATGGLMCIVSLRNPNRISGAVTDDVISSTSAAGRTCAVREASAGGASPV